MMCPDCKTLEIVRGLPGQVCEVCAAGLAAKRPKDDPINPPHYKGDYVMRIVEDFNLGFCLGNVAKYILRADSKAQLEDLKKARWYLDREISNREKSQQ